MSATRPPMLLHPFLVDLDNQLYLAMIDAVGETLAFRAMEALWRVLLDWPMPPIPDWSEENSSDPADQ